MFYLAQRKEEASAFIAEALESKLLIEPDGVLINGIYNHSVNCNLIADSQNTLDRIGQKHFILLSGMANSQPADQGARDGVLRQFVRNFLG